MGVCGGQSRYSLQGIYQTESWGCGGEKGMGRESMRLGNLQRSLLEALAEYQLMHT